MSPEVALSRTSGDVRLESAKWATSDLIQVAVSNRDFMGDISGASREQSEW
jgi:hypothetical protein